LYSSDKRKHKTLSAKAEMIMKLDKGIELNNFVKENGVGRATILDIRKKQREDCFVKSSKRGI
jgi:hypothetical protein